MMKPPLASPPYYVVAFSSTRTSDDQGYDDMASKMVALAAQQDGFLGVESARDSNGFGITNSFWRDEASILKWKAAVDHIEAQHLGKDRWYSHYNVRIGIVERAYGFDRFEPKD